MEPLSASVELAKKVAMASRGQVRVRRTIASLSSMSTWFVSLRLFGEYGQHIEHAALAQAQNPLPFAGSLEHMRSAT